MLCDSMASCEHLTELRIAETLQDNLNSDWNFNINKIIHPDNYRVCRFIYLDDSDALLDSQKDILKRNKSIHDALNIVALLRPFTVDKNSEWHRMILHTTHNKKIDERVKKVTELVDKLQLETSNNAIEVKNKLESTLNDLITIKRYMHMRLIKQKHDPLVLTPLPTSIKLNSDGNSIEQDSRNKINNIYSSLEKLDMSKFKLDEIDVESLRENLKNSDEAVNEMIKHLHL